MPTPYSTYSCHRKRLSPKFREKNSRRCDLLRKRNEQGLTDREALELDQLVEWVSTEVERVYPLPAIPAIPPYPQVLE